MTHPNVRRIIGSENPNDRSYTGLGHVDRDGTYHFPDGTKLPASGGIVRPGDPAHSGGSQRLVVREDASYGGLPTPDAADLRWSGLQWLHCVDSARQDAYDLAEFGSIGGDPVPVAFDSYDVGGILPPTGAHRGDPQGPKARAYEVGSDAWNTAVDASRRVHPERHEGINPSATTTTKES